MRIEVSLGTTAWLSCASHSYWIVAGSATPTTSIQKLLRKIS
jgi:hypothetical protein